VSSFFDQYDETWVLYDRQLVDDELYALWSRFAEGVRVVMLSDSCHSGTVARAMVVMRSPAQAIGRRMPLDVEEETYRAHKQEYDEIQSRIPPRTASPVQATIALVSGCMDNQTSADGRVNGRFTGRLLEVWDGGSFRGNLRKLRDAITLRMPEDQTPNYYVVGREDPKLLGRQAFEI
jgi:metacaspase-1